MSIEDSTRAAQAERLEGEGEEWPPRAALGRSVSSMTFFSSSDLTLGCRSEINVEVLSLSSVLVDAVEHQPPKNRPESRAQAIPRTEEQSSFTERLSDWLNVYFAEDRLGPDANLSVLELKMCLMILRRKFRIKDAPLSHEREPLSDALATIVRHRDIRSLKRTEEKNKFVFKHTIKMMKARLGGEGASPKTQDSASELLKRYGLPPTTLQHGSLSISRLREIFKNRQFAADFLAFLREPTVQESAFVQLYRASIKKKLIKTLHKWTAQAAPGSPDAMINYFLHNQQCKLPWTHAEVVSAIDCFLSTLGELALRESTP